MKFIFQPVKPYKITQRFGDNLVCINKATGELVDMPAGTKKCPVGYRSFYSNMKGHNGIDMKASHWQPLWPA